MTKCAVFVYSGEYAKYSYGPGHPMKLVRLKLTRDLLEACGMLNLPGVSVLPAVEAKEEDLLCFHTSEYLRVLERADNGMWFPEAWRYSLGPGDNPIVPGLYRVSLLSTGASLQAARLVESGEADVAFNIAGGLHHAMPARASGFCYLNDAAVAIWFLVGKQKRVAYVDIDAHHGDGVQHAFYETDRVLTISLHEDGRYLFPGTGSERELGSGPGLGYSVNLPLPPGTDDAVFLEAFERVVPPLLARFRPDILVTQLGADGLRSDPLTHLSLTMRGYGEAVRRLGSFGFPWVALGGGGYDVSAVPRAWTIAWGVMTGVEPPAELPDEYVAEASALGIGCRCLMDEPFEAIGRDKLMTEVERRVEYIEAEVFPRLPAPGQAVQC